jgi:O-acetylhomoserine/O-acetylserine sulfhydrylase-like pyridoxal-dependent enzyme
VIQLKKENNELNMRIKQLESGTGAATAVAAGSAADVSFSILNLSQDAE